MAEVAKNITQIGTSQQEIVQNEPSELWLRQKGEPALWFMRFKRYLDLGPKRSLRKALVAEPDTQKASKGTKNQAGKKLSDVSVPGAWKRASKVWRWVERAESYDFAQIEKQAAFIRQAVVGLPFASKSYRIIQLSQMATILKELGEAGLTLEQYFTYIPRMQSLMRDIAHELEGMDTATAMMADASAHEHLVEVAKKQTEEKLRKKDEEANKWLAAIEKEMKRRDMKPDTNRTGQ